MLSGRRAGAQTVLVRNGTKNESAHADLAVDSLAELREWIEGHARAR
jgi:phosphoglycolate phosphatase-like HAD superfamily hydrolase